MKRVAGPASYRKPPRVPRSGPRSGPRLVVLALFLWACHSVPVTDRLSLNPFSPQDDVRIGLEAYSEVLASGKVVRSGPERTQVERVMRRLVRVADDPGFEWEVNLLEDPQVNAFALPGGKMAVYTGILPVAGGDAGLAVVMGHEIGHVVARHGTERMTSALGVELALSWANLGNYTDLARTCLDLTLTLPFGREQESEADAIGLMYMARAGYDPREALAFWERMDALSSSQVPEFLSTHPSHQTRIARLRERMPAALEAWRSATDKGER